MTKLEQALIKEVRKLRLLTCKRGMPLILHGPEGVIIRDMLEMIADGYDFKFAGCGMLYIDGSPVFCEHELTKLNTYHGYIS